MKTFHVGDLYAEYDEKAQLLRLENDGDENPVLADLEQAQALRDWLNQELPK